MSPRQANSVCRAISFLPHVSSRRMRVRAGLHFSFSDAMKNPTYRCVSLFRFLIQTKGIKGKGKFRPAVSSRSWDASCFTAWELLLFRYPETFHAPYFPVGSSCPTWMLIKPGSGRLAGWHQVPIWLHIAQRPPGHRRPELRQ